MTNSQMQVQTVKVDDLKPHPKNPRRGDIKSIKESLEENGQFRPIIVQKSSGYIVGGNHTWKGAKDLGWPTVQVVYLDITDDQAKRIMLADNRTSDLGTYESDALVELLRSLDDPSLGTGYDDTAVNDILSAIVEDDEEAMTSLVRPSAPVKTALDEPTIPEIAVGADFDERLRQAKQRAEEKEAIRKELAEQKKKEKEEGLTEEEQQVQSLMDALADDDEVDDLDIAQAEMQAQLELMQDSFFPSGNYYGIPDLDPGMLVDSIPDPIDTWAGHDVTTDDGDTTYVVNYGLGGTRGLPWNRSILTFFTYDTTFDCWWDRPAYYTAKYYARGVRQAIVPDFSFWADEPRVLHLQRAYRAQWLGCFFQAAGIQVIPRFMWTDFESINYGVLGIPQSPPVAAVCIQAINDKEAAAQGSAEGLRLFVDKVKPEALILYSGNPGKRILEKAKLPSDLHVVQLDNYAHKRRGLAYDSIDGLEKVEKARKKTMKAKKVKIADIKGEHETLDEKRAKMYEDQQVHDEQLEIVQELKKGVRRKKPLAMAEVKADGPDDVPVEDTAAEVEGSSD